MNQSDLSTILSPQMVEETQRSFITRVFAWMTLGLLITTGASLFTVLNPAILAAVTTNIWLFIGLIIAEFGLVIFLTAALNRMSPAVASLSFIGYALLNGVTLSVIFLIYAASSIVETFLICACMFGIMSLFGYTTKRDLTSWGSLLFMGLIGVVIGSLINLFFQNSALYWIVTLVGIVVFIGLIAYDTQKLKAMSLVVSADGEAAQKASIIGALKLYLDFINLFLLLLRIFGRNK
ncbi:MAG: rane protein [Chloroflexi bacterium]|jgi:hypothetical protein|nr:rane protein [Chloroflexota bacterium]